MEAIRGETADLVWQLAHAALSARAGMGEAPQGSRAGDTIELLRVALEIESARERWVTSRAPALNPAFAVAEALWILAGSNDAQVLNYWFPRLPEFSGAGAKYHGAYGYRLRKHFGVDQIKRACEALTVNATSRQVVLQLWDASADLPKADGSPRSADVPCNIVALLKVREGRLEWSQIMRSNDLFRGLPYNIVQFTMLQEVIAGWLGVEIGTYFHFSDSLHFYVEDLNHFACEKNSSTLPNADSLAVDHAAGEALISDIYGRMEILSRPDLSERTISEAGSIDYAPSGYQNILRLLAAESARRRRLHDQAHALMGKCTNPVLVQLWTAWRDRVSSGACARPER